MAGAGHQATQPGTAKPAAAEGSGGPEDAALRLLGEDFSSNSSPVAGEIHLDESCSCSWAEDGSRRGGALLQGDFLALPGRIWARSDLERDRATASSTQESLEALRDLVFQMLH